MMTEPAIGYTFGATNIENNREGKRPRVITSQSWPHSKVQSWVTYACALSRRVAEVEA
jgi:hypothetical protein